MIFYTAKVNQYTLLGHFLFGMFLSLTRSRKENHRITRSRSYPQERTVPKIWTESLGSERAQKMAISIQLFSPRSLISPPHQSLSVNFFFRLTGPILCSHCCLQPQGKQVNWNLKFVNAEFSQCASSFLLPSSDLFCRLCKSASKPGGKVDERRIEGARMLYDYRVFLTFKAHWPQTIGYTFTVHVSI